MNTSTCKDNKHQTPGEPAFIITLAEAKEVKFYFDLMRKQLQKSREETANMSFYIRQITMILNQAKKERTITIQKKQ